MSNDMEKAVREYWAYCSRAMQQALINRFIEIQAVQPGAQGWYDFLADEFGLDYQD